MTNPNLRAAIENFRHALRQVMRVIMAGRVGILVAVLGVVTLTLVPQTKDLLSGADSLATLAAWAFLLGALFWATSAWFWVRWAITLDREGRSGSGPGRIVADWTPRLVAALTGAGAVCAGLRANGLVSATAIGAAVVAIVVVLLAFARRYIAHPAWLNADRNYAPAPPGAPWLARVRNQFAAAPFGERGCLILLGVSFVIGTALGLAPVATATPLGAGGVALLALGSVTGAFSIAIVLTTRTTGLPVISLMVVLAAIVAVTFNDGTAKLQVNHGIRPLGDRTPERITLDAAARAWLTTCGPALVGRDGRLKVVVVSTAGGASRAALWTAGVMARLEAEDATFPRRVFAISAVSGGALGAAGWVAQLHHAGLDCTTDTQPSREPRATANFALLGRDFLAPLVARWVLVDTAYGSAFPFNLMLHYLHVVPEDRAATLENAWEAAWRHTMPGSDTFAASFTALWGPQQARKLPLLFLNGTMVASGQPVITAPVTFGNGGIRASFDALEVLGSDVRLSTAVTNSARFPYVTPNGVVLTKNTMPDSIVDGGYFDNLGAGTLFQVVAALRAAYGDQAMALAGAGVGGMDIAVVQISSNPELLIYPSCTGKQEDCAKNPPQIAKLDLLQRCGGTIGLPASGAKAANTLDAQLAPILSIIATQSGHTSYRYAEMAAAFCPLSAKTPERAISHDYFVFSQCGPGIPGYPSLALNWVLPGATQDALTGAGKSALPGQFELCGNTKQANGYRAWVER